MGRRQRCQTEGCDKSALKGDHCIARGRGLNRPTARIHQLESILSDEVFKNYHSHKERKMNHLFSPPLSQLT